MYSTVYGTVYGTVDSKMVVDQVSLSGEGSSTVYSTMYGRMAVGPKSWKLAVHGTVEGAAVNGST